MKKIRLAVLNDNHTKIGPFTKKGTEIFDYIYITNLNRLKKKEVDITSFCAGSSSLPVKIESITYHSSIESKFIGEKHNLLFNMALTAKAISLQKKFDIFHVNNGIGENIIPFAKFIRKPIIVTMHGTTYDLYKQKFMNVVDIPDNVHFVSISNAQRKHLPKLNYVKTIYHGIDANKFLFHETGGKNIVWTGRATPDKGLDTVVLVAKKMKKPVRIFPIIKAEYFEWLHEEIIKKRDVVNQIVKLYIEFDVARSNLVTEYQNSKVFLFPLRWEEPFGFTVIESMSCGTPVISFARGAMPEIVKDGVTGLLVNPSPDDIRGNFITKKTGLEGLMEAVERIYSMPEADYLAMRRACRAHVESNFTVERMVSDYMEVYRKVLEKKS
jgi:glycosyltransferase involved in cell wall biosynthesis